MYSFFETLAMDIQQYSGNVSKKVQNLGKNCQSGKMEKPRFPNVLLTHEILVPKTERFSISQVDRGFSENFLLLIFFILKNFSSPPSENS